MILKIGQCDRFQSNGNFRDHKKYLLQVYSLKSIHIAMKGTNGADGNKLDTESLNSESVGFVLSDDMPFTDDEKEIFEGIERVSLGDTWLQGHACISIIHYQLDHI